MSFVPADFRTLGRPARSVVTIPSTLSQLPKRLRAGL